jgi:hypothetical protein
MLLLEVPFTLCSSERILVTGLREESFSGRCGEWLRNGRMPVFGDTADSGLMLGSADVSRSEGEVGGNLKFDCSVPGDFLGAVASFDVLILLAVGLLERFGAELSSFDSAIIGGETPSPRGDGCVLECGDEAEKGVRIQHSSTVL